jgi:hypothetical protein
MLKEYRYKYCRYCGEKLKVFYVKGGFCSFKCRAEYKKMTGGKL